MHPFIHTIPPFEFEPFLPDPCGPLAADLSALLHQLVGLDKSLGVAPQAEARDAQRR